jgi:hypothetical protein
MIVRGEMRRRRPPTARGRTTRALPAVLLVPVLSACSTSQAELHAELCSYFEADDFPQLELLATQTLDGVDHSLERLSTCDEWGTPRAVLIVQLRDRPSLESVVDLLAARGWQRAYDAGVDVFGSGGTVASVSADDGGAVVQISFSRDA